MEPIKIFKEKLGDELGKKALTSPSTYSLARWLFVVKNPYPFQGLKQMTDLGLEMTAKAYNRKHPVCFTTAFFPDELVHALDGVPFAPEVAAATATSLDLSPELLKYSEKMGMSRDLCSFHRVAGAGVPNHYFPVPDVYLARSHLCDGAPQLFRYLANKNNKPFYLLDVPSEYSESAIYYVAEQLEQLVFSLSELGIVNYDEQKLKTIIEQSNQAREAQIELNKVRSKYPGILPGEQAVTLVYLHFLCQGLQKTTEIYRLLAREIEAKAEQENLNFRQPRLLWSHLIPFYHNEIFTLIEELDVNIAFEEMNFVYWPPLDPEKPFISLARKVLSNPFIAPLENRLSAMKKIIDQFKIDGIIHFSHWGCRQAIGGVPILNQQVKKWGVGFLNLDADCVDQDNYFSGQIKTRLESFVEMLTF